MLPQIPGVWPVSASSMNYTCLLYGVFLMLMVVNWFADARKSYHPPSFGEFVETVVAGDDKEAYLQTGEQQHADIEDRQLSIHGIVT